LEIGIIGGIIAGIVIFEVITDGIVIFWIGI
jgi:hypothetical protein